MTGTGSSTSRVFGDCDPKVCVVRISGEEERVDWTGRKKRWLVSLGVCTWCGKRARDPVELPAPKKTGPPHPHHGSTTGRTKWKHRTARRWLVLVSSLAVKFWQKAVRPGAHSLPCPPTPTQPRSIKSRPSLSIAPGTSHSSSPASGSECQDVRGHLEARSTC